MSTVAEENLEAVCWHVNIRVPKYNVIYFHVAILLQTWRHWTPCNWKFQLNNTNCDSTESKDRAVFELNMILDNISSLVIYNAV